MNRLFRIAVFLIAYTGLGALLFRCARRRVRVLMYHGVCSPAGAEAPFGGRGKHLPADRFRRQMRWLRRHARLMSIDELARRLASGKQLPSRGIVVTLDDGYRNNHEHALPALAACRIPAAVYITTGFVEGCPFWTDRVDDAVEHTGAPGLRIPGSEQEWRLSTPTDRRRAAAAVRLQGKATSGGDREGLVAKVTSQAGRDLAQVPPADWPADTRPMEVAMIRDLHDAGVTIGSHTESHQILSRCDDDELRRELVGSRQRLEEWLGTKVVHFAYPNGAAGDFDERTEEAVRAAGYRSALLTVPGTMAAGDSSFRIRRLAVNGDEDLGEFIADLCGLRPALLALRNRVFRR